MSARSLAVVALSLLTGCGIAVESGGGFAPDATVSGPLTFAWNDEMDRSSGDPRLQNNRYFEDRLHEAIEWELGLRGIRRADSAPDLLVHHHLSLADHEIVMEGEGNTRSNTYIYEQGTIGVHLTDARTGANVWLGWARADVEPALTSPEQMRKWVFELVRRMFADWPTERR